MKRLDVQVAVVNGEVGDDDVAYAEDKVREVAAYAPAPVRFARLALSHETNPSITRRAVAKASLDVDGQPVRAHVAAEHFTEAADRLEDRLRRGLEALAAKRQERWRDTGDSGPGEWRHGDLPTDRPEYYPRPPEEREIVRRKTFALRELSPEEATLELDVLDLDWLLFTELTTGADAVIERRGDGYHLLLAGDTVVDTEELAVPIEAEAGVGTMEIEEAIEALDVSDLSYLFFVDAATGQGTAVYRRYDGHYGLIVPATGSGTTDSST